MRGKEWEAISEVKKEMMVPPAHSMKEEILNENI